MAYNKRTWLGRQGTGLNKFSIGGATPVTIVNQPDSVTQVGDALSAGNLNDLEDRIEDAFDETASQTEVSNLNNALTALDHRVSNLEQAKGDYVVQNYKDGSITPSGKGAWSIVEGLRGVSRVENQLIPISSVESQTVNGVTWTNNGDGSYTANGTATANSTIILQTLSVPSDAIKKDHVYLLNTGYTDSTGNSFRTELISRTSGNQNVLYVDCFAPLIVTPLDSGLNLYVELRVMNGKTANNLVFRPQLTDLNIYFGTTDLSFLGATDSAKLATIQTNYPHLLTPSEYGTRIVDSSYSGVRAWARNLVDIPTTTWASDGSKTFSIDIPIGTYTLSMTSSQARAWIAYLRDSDGEITQASSASSASGRQSVTFTLTRKATTLVVYVNGATVMSDVQIEEGSTATAYTPYHAPSTLSLSFQGKSAGSVYDSCEPNVEVGGVAKRRDTQRVTTYSFTGSEGWAWDAGGFWYMSGYTEKSKFDTVIASNGIFVRTYTNSNIVRVYSVDNPSVTSSTTMNTLFKSGTTMNYALYTEVVTLSDPIIDNTLLTESGGRMATVQTGTIVDGSFDMGFINL